MSWQLHGWLAAGRGRSACLLMLASALCSGCAHVWVDAAGNRHVLGLVAMTLPPADAAPRGADTLRTRAIGLTLTRSEVGSALVLGYHDSSLTAVRNHALVPLALLQDAGTDTGTQP